jgi:Tfp pilus assembly protein FimT
MLKRLSNERGIHITELAIVVALIGVIAVIGAPNLLTYWQSARLGAGAEELAGILAQARGLAIRGNTTVCAQRTGTDMRIVIPTCGGAVWTGPGTDGTGVFRLSNGLQITAGGATTFTGTGGATAGVTYQVTNPTNGSTRNVTVSTTGRVTW